MSLRPTVRQLEYFVALADALSFRRAAESCHVTQPALSTQLQTLEQLLGARLFERDRRRVLITEAGRQLLDRARAALAQVDGLVEAASLASDALQGTLRLGVIPTVAPYVLPAALRQVSQRHPQLRLLLREGETARLVELLHAGQLDLLLLALEANVDGLAVARLYTDPFVLLAPRQHPLAKQRQVREAELRHHEVLLLDDGH